MKKLTVIVGVALLVASAAQASILTNTNQSSQYMRMLSRNASTDIDAVYYNPAGLTQLADGFHLAVHNQTIFQEKTVILDPRFPFQSSSGTYVGKVNAPVFPSAFLVYKTGKLALSFGFGPNAGGGSADYADGLPSFESTFALLSILYNFLVWPVESYSVDIAFEGKSVFYGFQLNAAYAVTDWMSAAIGGRFLLCNNSYSGSINNFIIDFVLIGNVPLLTTPMELDAKQTGTGFTPIVSFNFKPMDALNISLKYEFQTKIELTNDTAVDDVALFPDGEKSRSDLPAILSLGVGYSLMPSLRAMVSFNYWFDKSMDWDGDPDNENNNNVLNLGANSWDLGAGFEFDVSPMFLVSAGFLHTQMTPGDDYQTDLRHELSSNTIGAGGQFKLSSQFDVNFGGLYTFYTDNTVGSLTFQRSNFGFTVGFGAHL